MNSKSATPSGSQRARAPGGWMKASAEAVRDLLSGLPQPWSTPAMLLDLDAHADREAHTGEPMPGRRALAARWGVGERVARTVIDRWHAEGPVGSARHRPAAVPVGVPLPSRVRPGGCPAEDATMPMDGASVDENRPASVPPPVPGGVPVPVPGVVENVCVDAASEGPSDYRLQTTDSLPVESQSAPADAPAEPGPSRAEVRRASLESLWAEFQAMRKAADPSARKLSLDVHLADLERCLKALKPVAKEYDCKPGEALLVGWWTWWYGKDPWYRTNRVGPDAVGSFLVVKTCKKLALAGLDAMAAARDAQTPPTADAVLDVLLAEGQDRAEARMPAWASTLRWTVARMGGDVAAMRTARSPERMRAAWATAWGEALARPRVATSADAAPPLALVAR